MAKNPFDQFDQPANAFDQFDNQPEPAKPASAARKLGDLGLGFASGAVGATKALTDAAGAGNKASQVLGSLNDGINDYLSPEAKADQQTLSAGMAEAKAKGFNWDGVKAGAKAFATAPGQAIAQGAGSIVPIIAGTALAPGAIPAAAVGAGIGIAMGVGTAKGAIYDEIKKRGGTEEEATKAQEYGGVNTDQIALGGALGAADALTGVSRAATGMIRGALGKEVVKQTATTAAERGILGRAGMGALKEMPLEAAQGGQEQVAANIAAQRAGYEAGTWDNVASNATLEALASAGPGAAFGAMDRNRSAPPEPVAPPVAPPGPNLSLDPNAQLAAVQSEEMGAPNVPQTTPPDGRAVLNAQQEQQRQQREAQLAAQRAVSSPDDEIFASTGALDPQQQAKAAILATVPQGQAPGVLARTAIAALDSGQTQQIELAQASAQDQAQPTVDTSSQSISDPLGAYQESMLSDADKQAAFLADGEIGNGEGKLFSRLDAATRRAAKESKAVKGVEWGVSPVYDGPEFMGFKVVRKGNSNVSTPTEIQSDTATSSGNDGNNAGAGVEVGATDGNGLGADTRGREADALVQSGESAGGNDDAAVMDGPDSSKGWVQIGSSNRKQQNASRDIENLNKRNDGYEYRVSRIDGADHAVERRKVGNVQNSAPAANDSQAQAAPSQAPEAVASDAAPAAELPGAGSAAVEGDGVDQVSQPAQPGTPGEGAGVSQPTQEANPNQKALDRIAKGTAYFGTNLKAAKFIADNGLKDTHEWVKTGASRFEVREKATTQEALQVPSERETRIASALANGGHVVGADLRDRTGMRLMGLTPEELKTIPADKVRAKPSAEAARTNSTTKGNEDGTQAAQAQPQQTQPEAGTDTGIQEPTTGAGVGGATEGVEKPSLRKAQAKRAADKQEEAPTVESVAKAIQQKVASNRRKYREKSRKEREAKGYAPNSTPESEQTDYDAEIGGAPGDQQQKSAAALLGNDPVPLIDMFVNGNFEASEDVFKEITGVRIRGLSAKDKKSALYKWANWTPDQIAQAEQSATDKEAARAEKFKQDDLKSDVLGAWLALDNLRVGETKVNGTETGQEFVIRTIASGFDKAHSQKKGVAPIYGFTDGKSFTTLKNGALTKFVKAAIAFGGLDKAMEYVNPPKPQAPAGFVVRDIKTADAPAETPMVKTMNDLMEVRQRIADQGQVVDDRLLSRERQLQAMVKELESDGQNDELDAEMQSYEAKPNPTYSGKPVAEVKPAPEVKANTVFTEDAAAAARARLKAKLNRLNTGVDPEMLMDGIILSGYHIEKGARTFVAYARAMIDDLGDGVKPYLKSWYMASKYDPRMAGMEGLDDAATMDAVNLDSLEKPAEIADTGTEETTTAEDTAKESLLGANDDTRRNATNDSEPLDQVFPESNPEDGAGGSVETSPGLRAPDTQGNGRPESGGTGRGNSLDGIEKPVLPSTPAEIRPLADGPVGKTEDRPQQLSGENPGNFVITDEFKLGQGTDGDKISGNLNAIRTLRKLQQENRYPTKAEQAIMARYVGWGGLKTVFDPKKADATDQYGKAQRELKTLLSPDEYRAANGSIRNAHYTAEGIVDGMWRVMRFMGFKGGRALEPTVGIGNFVGRMPADMAASTEWHASELDTTTGELAQMLYPEANILASTGFQDAPFADGAFDISVGNPPFGLQTITDKSPNRKHLNGQKIHNYIIAKAGMHLRPGGVMSMVVTHRFLDTANPEARDVLAKDFRFLGAFRLPNDAFKKNAGTDVVTDVVFLQKLGAEEKRERDASWLDVNGSITVDDQAMRVNRYYQDNPTHILGRSAMDGSMQRTGEAEYTVHSDGRDIGKAIDELMQTGFKHMAGVLEQSNNSKALAPAMLTQSDLPIGGVMVNDEGKIIRRELNDANGNAVVQELTPETLWKDQAADWQALHNAVLDIKAAAKAGKVTQEDANEVLALSRFLFKADGTPFDKPNKAVEAVYKLVEELAKPAKFQWTHDGSLLLIVGALNRKQLGEDGYKSLKGMLDLRNRTLRLIHAEQAGDSKMEEYRADLNKAYDAFVKENGYLSDSKNANLLEGDVGAEAGIEASYVPAISPAVAKSSGMPARAASAKKSDIMTRRVNFPYKEITHADSAPDALFASISEHGKVDLPYMAKITNKSVQSVIEELTSGDNPQLFRDPETGDYQEAERYLSGNVKHKLKLAKEKGLKSNIQALEKALPVDKTKDQVKPNIRGMWMPPEIFTEFLQTIGYKDARISAIASQGILQASGETLAMTDFGIQFRHGKRTPLDMFNSQASGKPIIISVTSNGKTYKDEQGTKEVNAMAERMGKVFQEWAYSDDDRVKRIVEAFNQNMNTHSPRTFDGVKYLKPVGANPSIVMRRTQLDGAWRMMQEKTMLADHVVGAGKTFTLIMGIMERRRMGLSRKPMVVVPNHLVTQWARDFYKLYPGAKVLAANPADFAKKNRRRLLARIATGDYDAVIVGHTSIGFMETPTEDLKAIVDEKLEGLKEALAEARLSGESKRTLGQIEDRIDRYEERLKDLAARPTDDIGIDFKALGIDHLSVDEAHEFKNLEYSTSGDRVVGMNDPNGSKKAFDLYSKVRGLLSRGGGVTFATGTPVSNSLVEIYTMMSYLAHDELVLRGQEHFDSWSGAYAATETRLEYTATQKLKPRRVLAGLNNLSALRQLYEQFADIITMSDLKRIYTEEMVAKNLRDGTNLNTEFPVPKVANGKRELITGDITPAQKEYMDYLVARMGQIEANKSDKEYMRIDNALNVLTDARKMSLDIRIVDPSAKRDENGKVATAAKNIKATYDKWDADRGTQLVFCDLSTPAKTAAKEARSIISATIEQLFGKDLAKQVKKQLEGKTFEQQWKLLVEKSEEISDNPDTSEEKRDAIAEFMGKIEDPEATMNVADIGFSVYDDLKSVLMDSGIPESEIAFIHDYNTPDQKEKLFDRVNNGYVRVLIGSSMKMGAGTNAQRRLVALHHMDAPWRPSDVEQREGRIIRQGNMLYERDPDGFEVEIKAYSTNQTSDTVMWQILQRKAGAIEQFREGGLDSMEEEGGDSDQYAEFMATSTGNPVFRQKLEAERRLTEIESEIGGALIVRSNANSFLESYDRRRKAAKIRQEATETFDASTASYGGESGTQAEFEAAMKVANDDYLAKYAVWTQKNAAADLAIAKWETEPEIMRGDKPSKPMMPSQPDLYTKSVQAVSGYARAIGMALNEAAIDKNTKVTMATGSLIVTGQTMTSGPYWTVYANNMGENFSLDSSGAQKASASTRIIQALTPFSLSNELNTKARQYAREIGELDTGKTEALKGSKLEVDTTARDAARVELRWFTAQVAFAEVQADIDRGATKNRYIERDKRRNISQNQAKALTEPVKHTIDGVKYTTTGLNAHSGYEAIAQATRDSDGVSAYIVAQQNKEKITYAVAVQPAKLRKTEASTNLKQTGAPEANTSDVVFSRPVFSRGAQTQANKSVEAIAMAIASKWEGSPEIVVAFDMNDPRIDEEVRKEDQRQRSGGATGTPEGFYYEGTVYLMSSKLGTPNDIARVLFHESLGHYGLRGTFGKALRPILRDVAMLRRAEVDAKIKQYGLKMGNTLDRFTAAEEVLAELAQTKPEIGFVQRAIAAIRTWLRQNVPGFNNLRLTDAELIRNYILPARAFVENGRKQSATANGAPAFALKEVDGKSSVLSKDGKFQGWPKFNTWTRAEYKDVVSLLPKEYRYDSYRREPLPTQDRDARTAAALPEIKELNSGIGGAKGFGVDGLGNIVADMRDGVSTRDLIKAADIADKHGLGVFVTGVRTGSIPGLMDAGFVSEMGLGGVLARVTKSSAPVMPMASGVVNNTAYGTMMAYKPRGFAAPMFSRGTNDAMTNNDVVGNQGGRSADDTTPGGTHPFNGFTREQFLGNPKITSDANAKDLVPSTWKSLESEKNVPFAIGSGLTARYSELSAAVYNEKGDVVASYSSGDTLVVNKKYRRQGIGSELVYQWRMRNPNSKTAATRTKKSQLLQEKVWNRIRSERALYESRIHQDSNESTAPDSGGAMFSRTIGETLTTAANNFVVPDVGKKFGNRLADFRGIALQALGRRQLVDIYGKDLPQLAAYSDMVAQMDADKNEAGAEADSLATEWGNLDESPLGGLAKHPGMERKLAELMHDATLAQIDPDKDFVAGDDENQYEALRDGFEQLSPKAQATYRKARGMYADHNEKVRQAIRERIERSEMSPAKRKALLERMDGEFFQKVKGVYFPLARFGQYLTIVKDSEGTVLNVSRSETLNEADETRKILLKEYPASGGFTVGKVLKEKEFNAARDGVGRGFMADLFETLEKTEAGEELIDSISQLYLAALPDLSWAKHGIHRKGTPGFSQDARRAFAQNMFHGARYLAKLRYADQLQTHLDDMQEHIGAKSADDGFDSVKAQQVADEMVKRHDSMMNPESHPISTALTSFGFVFHLGLSPASAMVNLSQTALVALPVMGAKWGFGKSSAALLTASKQAASNRNDISKVLKGDELRAYNEAVRSGVIDVTMAHDLAGIAQGEDSKVAAKVRPVMKWASYLFHHAEKFNRQVTFVAAYRLAREAGAEHSKAYADAVKATYDGHFDYSASNRARLLQGNWQKVILLFKQYAQNMIYTLSRQAYQAVKAGTLQERKEARKALSGLLVAHAMAAGVLGLPVVGMLLSAASMVGGDDDEPWDAKVALQNMLADTLGQKPAEVIAHGLSRLTPWDISGRVGLDKLLLPDIQEGLSGTPAAQAMLASAAGPVAGIGVNMVKGLAEMGEGQYQRGLESMMPTALRGPLKAYRFAAEGNIDKTGVPINDEVSAAGIAGQALGLSPSETRLAQEGKSAIYSADRAVQARRSDLMRAYAMAAIDSDAEVMAETREKITRFNEKNPTSRIMPMHLMASVRARKKRIEESKQGVYLPKKRQDAMEVGRFAVVD